MDERSNPFRSQQGGNVLLHIVQITWRYIFKFYDQCKFFSEFMIFMLVKAKQTAHKCIHKIELCTSSAIEALLFSYPHNGSHRRKDLHRTSVLFLVSCTLVLLFFQEAHLRKPLILHVLSEGLLRNFTLALQVVNVTNQGTIRFILWKKTNL